MNTPALTARQKQVLGLIAQGYTDKRISEALGITLVTVHRHVADLRIRLDATNRANAVYQAGLRGIITFGQGQP